MDGLYIEKKQFFITETTVLIFKVEFFSALVLRVPRVWTRVSLSTAENNVEVLLQKASRETTVVVAARAAARVMLPSLALLPALAAAHAAFGTKPCLSAE